MTGTEGQARKEQDKGAEFANAMREARSKVEGKLHPLGGMNSPPSARKKETIQNIHALINIAYKRKALIAPEAIEPFLKALEAQPAAERTAPTREAIERILFKMVTEHKDKIDIGKAADEIIALDAQERAGAKAD